MEKLNEVKQALKYLEIDAKAYADNFSASMIVSTKNILAIVEAFRALEQRAEAAEAKLAELEKQKPSCSHHWIRSEGRTASGWLCSKCGDYDGPAPAADLAGLVPDEMPTSHIYHGGNGAFNAGKESGWNACRAAMLAKLEGDK